jgi:hypothetical protein
MSVPQQSGDLIFPQPFGHFAIETLVPSAFSIVSGTRSLSQEAHFIPITPIPHDEQEY